MTGWDDHMERIEVERATAQANVEALNEACRELTYEQGRYLLDHLVGGIAAYVPVERWGAALERAARFAEGR